MSDASEKRSIIILVLLVAACAIFGYLIHEHDKHLHDLVRKAHEQDLRLQARLVALEKKLAAKADQAMGAIE
ncbi:MAG: hypothetical protein OHK005_20760 [Candidatus Methylacidiphilales bacterium]